MGALMALCTEAIALAPSPVAAATRFIEPERTSPTANTPGTLVSNGSGVRPRSAEVGAVQLDVGPDEAVILGGDPGQPVGGRLGADKAEQARARLGLRGIGRA